MMNLIEIFQRLGPEEKHPVFLWSKTSEGWKRRLMWNPVAQFLGSKEELPSFVEEHKGNLLVGYLAYDKGEGEFPELCFFAYDQFLEENSPMTDELDEILKRPPCGAEYDLNLYPQVTFEDYEQAFKKVKEYIVAGHIYQMNLTIPFSSMTEVDPKSLFLHFVEEHTVDFMAYMAVDSEHHIVSVSPERFIHTLDDKIHTYPVKGTRPRGETPEEDEQERQSLLNDKKEEAELNMITDLLRNDVGKVSKSGSVHLRVHREARAHPGVWHTHSHVEGTLKVSPVEALLSMFPGGSITGCPKIRAMEIIQEVEARPRGVYTGSLGMIEPNGDIDFNILIRTLLIHKNQAHLQVGGGLVYDSQLESEWEEIFNKARPFQ